jgi:hypothetical protein
MTRDMDLLRLILLKVEGYTYTYPDLSPLTIDGYDWQVVGEHIKLLTESAYLDSMEVDYGLCPTRLTMKGHDFLDSIRNDGVWKKVKEKVKEKGGGFTMEILKALATQALSQLLGLAAGT